MDTVEMIQPKPRDRKVQVMVYLTQSVAEAIEAAAQTAGMSRSAYVNEILLRYIRLTQSQPGTG